MEINQTISGGVGHVDEATKCLGYVTAPVSVEHYSRITGMLIGGGMSPSDAHQIMRKIMRD